MERLRIFLNRVKKGYLETSRHYPDGYLDVENAIELRDLQWERLADLRNIGKTHMGVVKRARNVILAEYRMRELITQESIPDEELLARARSFTPEGLRAAWSWFNDRLHIHTRSITSGKTQEELDFHTNRSRASNFARLAIAVQLARYQNAT